MKSGDLVLIQQSFFDGSLAILTCKADHIDDAWFVVVVVNNKVLHTLFFKDEISEIQ